MTIRRGGLAHVSLRHQSNEHSQNKTLQEHEQQRFRRFPLLIIRLKIYDPSQTALRSFSN